MTEQRKSREELEKEQAEFADRLTAFLQEYEALKIKHGLQFAVHLSTSKAGIFPQMTVENTKKVAPVVKAVPDKE